MSVQLYEKYKSKIDTLTSEHTVIIFHHTKLDTFGYNIYFDIEKNRIHLVSKDIKNYYIPSILNTKIIQTNYIKY